MNGISKTKCCKGTDIPKRSGNYSFQNSLAYQKHYQRRDYPVTNKNGCITVGNATPLVSIFPEHVIWLMENDPNFKEYRQEGTHTENGKQYRCGRTITKQFSSAYGASDWLMSEWITTDGDFDYTFREY